MMNGPGTSRLRTVTAVEDLGSTTPMTSELWYVDIYRSREQLMRLSSSQKEGGWRMIIIRGIGADLEAREFFF